MWVITDIVKQTSIEAAALHATQWIKIAEKCLAINNFSSMVHIVSALMLPELQKLKLVWGQVTAKNAYNKLKALMEGNYSKLQDKLHNNVQPPCLPYIGAYLHSLTEIDEKYPNLVRGLINFEKRTLMATDISEILQYQQTLFCLEAVPFIQEWIESEEVWTPEQINEASAPLMNKPEKARPLKRTMMKGSSGSFSSSEDDPDCVVRSPSTASSNLYLSRTTSSKLAKILGKEFDEAQQLPKQTIPPSATNSSAQSKRTWTNSISTGRESTEEMGIDKRQTLKLQFVSLLLDDAEFKQSVQVSLLPHVGSASSKSTTHV